MSHKFNTPQFDEFFYEGLIRHQHIASSWRGSTKFSSQQCSELVSALFGIKLQRVQFILRQIAQS